MNEFNAAILAKIARSRLTRYEGLAIPREIVLYSPEIKRLYARYFDGLDANFQHIMRIALRQFPPGTADRVQDAIHEDIAACGRVMEEEIANMQRLFERHAVIDLIAYPDSPLAVTATMKSSTGRSTWLSCCKPTR